MPSDSSTDGPGSVYVLGDQLSLADLHLFVWFTRIVRICGGGLSPDAAQLIEVKVNESGGTWKLGAELKAFWAAMLDRPSVRKVYENGIH